jgi:hypothetical protein
VPFIRQFDFGGGEVVVEDDGRVAYADQEPEIAIHLDNSPIAWLAVGAKPGWSAFVIGDGPLARYREPLASEFTA